LRGTHCSRVYNGIWYNNRYTDLISERSTLKQLSLPYYFSVFKHKVFIFIKFARIWYSKFECIDARALRVNRAAQQKFHLTSNNIHSALGDKTRNHWCVYATRMVYGVIGFSLLKLLVRWNIMKIRLATDFFFCFSKETDYNTNKRTKFKSALSELCRPWLLFNIESKVDAVVKYCTLYLWYNIVRFTRCIPPAPDIVKSNIQFWNSGWLFK